VKTIKIKQSQQVPAGSFVEGSQIEAKYPLSHVAVQLVREYDEDALYSIGTIADMPGGGAYGYYSTAENVHEMPQEVAERVRLVFNTNNINLIPKALLKQTVPEFDEQSMRIGDTIHVNIDRILKEFEHPDPVVFHFNVIKEIAKTILHEATHVRETEETGQTSEYSAGQAETPFGLEIDKNFERIAMEIKNTLGLQEDIPSQTTEDQPQS